MSLNVSPNLLDKYRIIAQLGRGGMADVYLAANSGPGGFSKLLVLKVMHAGLAQQVDFLTMFRDEARLAARLNHPNVVSTYEVGECGDEHYIAMEYLEGQPLHRVSEAFSTKGYASTAVSLRIAIDALSGLHYAHELRDFEGRPLGVVHRDITPHNIFVTYEGQVKVVDFGIAKAQDSSSQTRAGTVKGKLAYMAPEQARGETVTRSADVFSMGVILWELLAGRRLWDGLSDIAVIGRLASGDIESLGRVRPQLPPRLCRTVMRALCPNPRLRPQTARALQRDLEEHSDLLTERISTRRLGELMREAFREERAQVRKIVAKQLERLERTPDSTRTPSVGARLNGVAGDMPILGEGSQIHDAITRLHTESIVVAAASTPAAGVASGMTAPRSNSSPGGALAETNPKETSAEPPPSSSPGVADTGHSRSTDATFASQNQRYIWVALTAVGLAGVSLGVLKPWSRLPNADTPSAPTTNDSPPAQAILAPAWSPNRRDSISLSSTGCDAATKPLVELSGEIAADATLGCDKDYLLRFTTYVSAGATLTIQPGTTLFGDAQTRGILVVKPGGRIVAAGTANEPIVFTSSAPDGERRMGDWGGVVILGEAPTNLRDKDGNPMPGRIEGIANGGEYGGNDERDSSGILRYLRIEYSGTEIAPNNEINGLTFGAVGRGTVVDHVQVRHTLDDCFEFFGGNVDAKHLVCQAPGDDAFDWDFGYTGRLQFLVSQADTKVHGDSHGLEGDNDPNGSTNTPFSHPIIYNATLCGKNRRMEAQEHYGVLLRRGSRVTLRNGLFTGFSAGLDVRDEGSRPDIAASIFFRNLVENLAYEEDPSALQSERVLYNDDAGFDEGAYLRLPHLLVATTDPHIGNCFDPLTPSFKPRHPLVHGAALPPEDDFFDHSAQFIGAFRDATDDWDAGTWVKWSP